MNSSQSAGSDCTSGRFPRYTLLVILAMQIALILVSSLLILTVLLHKGRGGGLSDMFGGGISSTMGGSSVAERNLNRITLALAAIWVAIVVSLGLLLSAS